MTININEKVEDVSGSKVTWLRTKTISIDNPTNGPVTIILGLEEATRWPDGSISSISKGNIKKIIGPPQLQEQFMIVNPNDGSDIGLTSYGTQIQNLYVLFYSLLVKLLNDKER